MISVTRELIVNSITFGQNGLMIHYMETKNQSDRGGIESTLTLLDFNDMELIDAVQEAMAEVVEKFLLDLRDPPATLSGNPLDRIKKSTDGED
jgi:hypothetical protein